MKIYSKIGDSGETFYKGNMRSKNEIIFDILGDLDEVQAHIGLVYELTKVHELKNIVNDIYELSSLIYTNKDKNIIAGRTEVLEKEIDHYMEGKELKGFVLPIGSEVIAHIHIARTVVRRLERAMSCLNNMENIKAYINRLSDYLFSLAIEERENTKL